MTGIISRRIVEKALFHSLGHLPVSEYMHTEFMEADPLTPVAAIQDYLLAHNHRLVPVFDQGEVTGVVTRTDLLRSMYVSEAIYDLARDNIPVRVRELAGMMGKHLSRRIFLILRDLGNVGEELDLPVYAVGGFVRDLLLGIKNNDVDVTVEGNGILFAEAFARRYDCRCKGHEKFGTAVIIFPDGFKIDVASTRLEYYSSPGALPTVERSSLKMDLYRRDFTINTLAIRLNSAAFGQLIDYFGAQRDLQDRLIRVLHNLSFVEDPTRVFRAIRFEQRLDFHIAKHTENLIKNAVRMSFLDRLGGKRLLTELVYILREKDPLRGVERMAALGLLRFVNPDLKLLPETRQVIEEAKKIVTWFELLFLERRYEKWAVYFLSLCDPLTNEQFWVTCTRLSVNEHYKEKLFESRKRGGTVLEAMAKRVMRREALLRSEIYHWLKDLPVEVLLYMMARTGNEEVKRVISLYFTQLQNVRCLITGDDLKKLGVSEGPRYRQILDAVLDARLNGVAGTREDELKVAREMLGHG
jgi:tRNA nucleotidyltransferase (CCA-adding enzyme)